ncbi:hypothetical protein O6H91_08G047900 [Diphasiastrum complanatum]|uniref:Uncharacterized protein n=1 Tax=Diphasiastrum complanatum TaxID=34168 RepID=A0ACC2CX78_DIPCM|nr:hypothetical protein O6H91_Y473000 [Diphasiastrum complanatum]KAJ7546633.1 hypothetical protein O6H91_08G047900 [Diphasiastrum complanatum]
MKKSEVSCKLLDETSALPRPLSMCSCRNRDDQTVVSNFGGCLLQSRSSYPYFLLLAFETGWIIRSAALLLLSPIAWVLYHFLSEEAASKLLIFVAVAGVKMQQIEMLSRSVLLKFFSEDINTETLSVFSSFGRRYIVTKTPRIMVEPFAKEYLGALGVIGTELELSRSGRATGFVRSPGILVGEKKKSVLKATFNAVDNNLHVGLGDRKDYPSMSMFKEVYIVSSSGPKSKNPSVLRPIIFHDGRLVQRPTPLVALFTLIWIPFGFLLAVIRIMAAQILPLSVLYYVFPFLGVRIVVTGTPPAAVSGAKKRTGVLFVCSHRTLLDPIFLSIALRRPITAVTYFISRLSELLSPIPTVRLTRYRQEDAKNIANILKHGDLAICPEGTTCRSPFLLRALFAELTDQIVPVAMTNKTSMFHATSSGSWKAMDPFYFFMNPFPSYDVTFLSQLPLEQTCSGGKAAHDVANNIQRLLGRELGFECTTLTRKDKYLALVGTDGSFPVIRGSGYICKTSTSVTTH